MWAGQAGKPYQPESCKYLRQLILLNRNISTIISCYSSTQKTMDIFTSSMPQYLKLRVNKIKPAGNHVRRIIRSITGITLLVLLLLASGFNSFAASAEGGVKEKSTPKVAIANIVTGKVMDADTKEPLVGASVTIKGTSKSASTGLDGTFKIDVSATENPVLVISYIGYVPKEVPVNGVNNIGDIGLKYSATGMSEVVVNGDIAIDRKTPVAVSTIGAQYIEEHIGTQDIPELLNIVPGVYATQQQRWL
jgi:hypothetical protein